MDIAPVLANGHPSIDDLATLASVSVLIGLLQVALFQLFHFLVIFVMMTDRDLDIEVDLLLLLLGMVQVSRE